MKFMHNIKAFLGCGGEFEATDKYRTKRTLTWVKKCTIILSNHGGGYDWRFDDLWKEDVEWFEANVVVVDLPRYMSLY